MIENDVTWPKVTRSDPEVTSFTGSRLEVAIEGRKLVYCTFHFLQSCSSQYEAVTRQETTSSYLRLPKVTRKWRHLTGSHQEVAAEGRKLAYTVHFTSYKAVARTRRQSRDRK